MAVACRASEEKRRMKTLLDLEWRKRQSMLDMLDYPHKRGYLDKITYLNEHRWQYRKWSDEEVYNMITLDGLNCRPEDHKVRATLRASCRWQQAAAYD